MIEVGPLRPDDRAAWEVLARGYKDFYRDTLPDEMYEVTWRQLAAGTELHGLGARLDGRPRPARPGPPRGMIRQARGLART